MFWAIILVANAPTTETFFFGNSTKIQRYESTLNKKASFRQIYNITIG